MQDRPDQAWVELAARLRDESEKRGWGSRELWAMTRAQREAAMWRGELTSDQLREWAARAPQEVPLIGREFAFIAMLEPEWADADDG
jgi:hypothetical protein